MVGRRGGKAQSGKGLNTGSEGEKCSGPLEKDVLAEAPEQFLS